MIVPVPLTPAVFGCRVAEIIVCPCSLSSCDTIAISCVPPDKNPPCCTSTTLITAGLYCSRYGIENRSFTFSTTTPIVCCCPTLSDRLCGSNRSCALFVPLGTVVAAPKDVGVVAGAPGEEGTAAPPGTCCVVFPEPCGVDVCGSLFGNRTAASRRTCTCDSVPVYNGRKFARVHSGRRTICGVRIIRISSSSLWCWSSEKK